MAKTEAKRKASPEAQNHIQLTARCIELATAVEIDAAGCVVRIELDCGELAHHTSRADFAARIPHGRRHSAGFPSRRKRKMRKGARLPDRAPFHACYIAKLWHARATTGRYPRATPWPARERDSEQGRWGSAKSSRPDSENYVSTTYTPSATIVAWRSAESDPLVKLANLNMQPAFRITFHIGADPSTRYLLAVAVNPSDRIRTGRRAERNQPSLCQQVHVELQALLQACSLSRSGHQLSSVPIWQYSAFRVLPLPFHRGQRHWREHCCSTV